MNTFDDLSKTVQINLEKMTSEKVLKHLTTDNYGTGFIMSI